MKFFESDEVYLRRKYSEFVSENNFILEFKSACERSEKDLLELIGLPRDVPICQTFLSIYRGVLIMDTKFIGEESDIVLSSKVTKRFKAIYNPLLTMIVDGSERIAKEKILLYMSICAYYIANVKFLLDYFSNKKKFTSEIEEAHKRYERLIIHTQFKSLKNLILPAMVVLLFFPITIPWYVIQRHINQERAESDDIALKQLFAFRMFGFKTILTGPFSSISIYNE